MATSISSLGVGSGLDLSGLLGQLEAAESAPLAQIQSRAASFTSRLSGYAQIRSALDAIQAAADKLSEPALFNTLRAGVGDASVLSAAASADALAGDYRIDVSQLARSQSLVSSPIADPQAAIGTGTVTIDFGTISGGTLDDASGQYVGAAFAPDAQRDALRLEIGEGGNTLEGIRDAINQADAGVAASLVDTGGDTPYRLVLASTRSGEASSLRIAVDGDGALQDLLGYEPSGTQALRQTAAAQDAKLSINGIDVVSASNRVAGAIQGTTLTLEATGSTTLKLTSDTAVVRSAVQGFVKAFNTLQTTATSLSAYDAQEQKASVLTGDPTLRSVLTRLRQALATPNEAGGGLTLLGQIGVSLQQDGTLAVDGDALDAALSQNPRGVAALFSSEAGSSAGFGKQVSALVTELTSGNGLLQAASDGVNATLDDLSAQYNATQDRVDRTIARYRQQFTRLDVLVSSMNNTMTYLTQQFEAMNATNSSN